MNHGIKIDLDKKCVSCGKNGAMDNGYCLKCVNKEMAQGNFSRVPKELDEFVEQALKEK